jgi:hypothetical protein
MVRTLQGRRRALASGEDETDNRQGRRQERAMPICDSWAPGGSGDKWGEQYQQAAQRPTALRL